MYRGDNNENYPLQVIIGHTDTFVFVVFFVLLLLLFRFVLFFFLNPGGRV